MERKPMGIGEVAANDNDALLRVAEQARQLNHMIDIERLERMLFIYRSWISSASGSVEGGFSLTRDELDCVLEYPADPRHLDFLMATFQANSAAQIDFLTLLATCTCLARGPLQAKARFLFQLVDLDTEDEIVEDELAMLIAVCNNGLWRLRIIVTELCDVDARAIACEAFEFVGIEDGGKMSHALLVQWLVFHFRPAALFNRLQSVLLLSQLVQRLHAALKHQQQAFVSSPFHIYNGAHFENRNAEADHARVLVGPIIGPVTLYSVKVLLEVDHSTAVQCFAFQVGSDAAKSDPSKRSLGRVYSFELTAFQPQVVELDGLEPGQTYQFRLLGVSKRDRDRCVAVASTPIATTESLSGKAKLQGAQWELRAINHEGIGRHAEPYCQLVRERLTAAEAKTAITTIHFSTIQFNAHALATITRLLNDEWEPSREMVTAVLRNVFRDALSAPEFFDLLRMHSNLLVSSRQDMLFSGRITANNMSESMAARVHELLMEPWRMYIGQLWGIATDEEIAIIPRDNHSVLIDFEPTRLAPESIHLKNNTEMILATLPPTQNVVFVSESPLLCFPDDTQSDADNESPKAPYLDDVARNLTPLIEWKRQELARNVCLMSKSATCGSEMQLTIQTTTISIPQIVCGPAVGHFDSVHANTGARSLENDPSFVALSSRERTSTPHYARVACHTAQSASRPGSHASTSRPTSRSAARSSHGDRASEPTQLSCSLVKLEDTGGVRILTGPRIGRVSCSTATVSLEGDRAGEVSICLTDRLTGKAFHTRLQTRLNRSVSCVVRGLSPLHVYDLTTKGATAPFIGLIHTPPREPASTRILLLADHSFCDQTVSVRRGVSSSSSHVTNALAHLAGGRSNSRPTGHLFFDVAIRMGTVSGLRHDLLGGYQLTCRQSRSGLAALNDMDQRLEEMIRSCYRTHAVVADYRALLSRGAHHVASIGITRSLVQNGAPLRLLRTVRRVVRECEQQAHNVDTSDVLVELLPGPFKTVALDTTDCLLLGKRDETVVQWPESLLTTPQLDALRHALAPSRDSSQVLILCDAPIVWPFAMAPTIDNNHQHAMPTLPRQRDAVLDIAKDPWFFYPHDVRKLLHLVFAAMQKDPLLRATLICCGPFASRVVVSDTQTGLSIEQLTLGAVSNVEWVGRDGQPTPVAAARFTSERLRDHLHPAFTVMGDIISGSSVSSKQYCVLDVVPHARGAVARHTFYVSGKPEASIVVGPIIGRVTSRTARILFEVDRFVEKAQCVLTATNASMHSVSSECDLEPLVPTIFKLEGLHPGTRYKIQLEGVMVSTDDRSGGGHGYVETPALVPLSMEWLVFSRNNLHKLLPTAQQAKDDQARSHWHRILAPGVRFFHAQRASSVAIANGDTLGEAVDPLSDTFNPWHHVEAFALSPPLRQTQLSVHLGGQVDLDTAFTDDELRSLILQLCESDDELRTMELYATIRGRLQDVYRTTWGVEPMRTILASTSNVMLLHEATDLFFSTSHLQALMQQQPQQQQNTLCSEQQLAEVAAKLRAMAFELWQLYQNQLCVDVNESDLDNSRRNSSKFASHVTLGMCRLVFLNVSDELRDALSNSSADTTGDKKVQSVVPPLALPAPAATTTAGERDPHQLPLLSVATWKTLDEALELIVATTGDTGSPTKSSSNKKAKNSSIKQLAVFLPVDLIEVVATHTVAVRADVTRLFEKLFQWKLFARKDRNVTLVCCSDRLSSRSFTVTDEKVNETLTMTRVASISECLPVSTKPKPKANQQVKTKATSTPSTGDPIKGHFSKRFTYLSQPIATSLSKTSSSARALTATTTAAPAKYRSYAKYQYLSDYRRGVLHENLLYFPSRTLAKIVLGPVIGRIVRRHPHSSNDNTTATTTTTCSVPILLEVNAPARVTCVVVDSMRNLEVRATLELAADTPQIFCIHELTPLRRYVYYFEGVSNSDSRRGSFHTPPPLSPPDTTASSLNIVALSSHFPTQMDDDSDSLWVPLLERATRAWCGLDAVLHLGGQVPLHEAAIECLRFASQELQREILHGDRKCLGRQRNQRIREKVRRRFQQEYVLCWNLPHIRELLASVSHWFVRGKADMAPFLGHDSAAFVSNSRAAKLVLSVANQVVNSYQVALMSALEDGNQDKDHDHGSVKAVATAEVASLAQNETVETPLRLKLASESAAGDPHQLRVSSGSRDTLEGGTTGTASAELASAPAAADSSSTAADAGAAKASCSGEDETTCPSDGPNSSGGALYWQHESIAVFMCDTRNAHLPKDHENDDGDNNDDDDDDGDEVEPITCNGRLSRPLSRLESPMIGESQWRYLESALRKKKTHLFILCLELPLILTNADHVETLRDELLGRPAPSATTNNDEGAAHWPLYDHTRVQQHWVACKRQLEQLLLLLFKWKAKRSGRDVLVLSGGMRIGIDTLLQDRESQLTIRNLTVGPVTASVDPLAFPLSGVACATLAGGLKDDHFTFHHSLVAKKNYLLLQARVEPPQTHDQKLQKPTTKATKKSAAPPEAPLSTASSSSSGDRGAALAHVTADFIVNDAASLDRIHPVDKLRRLPQWWTLYVPMGKSVFWDDSITLKSETDAQMLALRDYVARDRGLQGALELFYEKYQFAETARMEQLRSRHLQHVDLVHSFRHSVLGQDLWRVIPESKRQQMAYFLDTFVRDLLWQQVSDAELFTQRLQTGEPIELALFARVVREFVFGACLLRLTLETQAQDELLAQQRAVEQAVRATQQAALDRQKQEEQAAQQAARMAELLRSDPHAYATIKLAETQALELQKQQRHDEKIARKKAERLAEMEEEQAIAKEQKKLDKVAERGDAIEYERRQTELDARIRRLRETRAQRDAQKKNKTTNKTETETKS